MFCFPAFMSRRLALSLGNHSSRNPTHGMDSGNALFAVNLRCRAYKPNVMIGKMIAGRKRVSNDIYPKAWMHAPHNVTRSSMM